MKVQEKVVLLHRKTIDDASLELVEMMKRIGVQNVRDAFFLAAAAEGVIFKITTKDLK